MRAFREAPRRLAVALLAAVSSAAAVHAQTGAQALPVAPAFEAEP